MSDNYYYLKEKHKEVDMLYHELLSISEDARDEAIEEFVTKYNCDYEIQDDGFSLLNSDTEDMEWVIDDFVKSGCKNWKEFSNYLADDLISILRKYLESIGD